MRTVIFIGLMAIAFAISGDWMVTMGEGTRTVVHYVMAIVIIMDLTDFILSMIKTFRN